MPGIERTRSRAREVAARLRSAPAVPLVAALCILQLLIGIAVALTATHNHFVWYSGGDATEYWTASWWLSHGALGQTLIGYGVPVLWAWLPPLAGAPMLAGLPVITIVQLVVLVPLALVLFFRVADLLFGRAFAWWATAVWIVGPWLLYLGFSTSYAHQFRDLFLAPHWFGLTNMADLPSLVLVLASTWAGLRLLERKTVADGAIAGLIVGAAIGTKPANALFLPALFVLLLGVRRASALVACAAAFVPALVTLAVWKQRGRGTLPLFSLGGERHEAVGHGTVAAVHISAYLPVNWTHAMQELHDLGDVFWSVRVLEFVVIAGAIGLIRRDALKGLFVVLWFAAYCLLKGSSETASITSLSYFRFVIPGLPALALIAAGLVYLVPRRGRDFAEVPTPSALPNRRVTVGATAAVLGLVPLLVVLIAKPASSSTYAWVPAIANDAPLSKSLAASVTASGDTVRLAWAPASTYGAHAYYVVYRSADGDGCSEPAAGAKECDLTMDVAGMTGEPSFVDHPGKGRHWYRVALMSNYRSVQDGSDLMLLGPATSARTAR